MKTFVLVLALLAVALAAPADDDNQKKSKKVREKGNTEYDANLKFEWKGDSSWNSQFLAALKPIADTLNAVGFKGNLNSDSNGQGGGNVSGHFRLSSKRGNGAKLGDASDNPSQNSGNDAIAEASSSAKSGPGGVSIPEESSLSGGKSGRGGLPNHG